MQQVTNCTVGGVINTANGNFTAHVLKNGIVDGDIFKGNSCVQYILLLKEMG